MNQPVLLIIETSDVGAAYTSDAALQLGFKPLFLADLSNYQADTLMQLSLTAVLNMPTQDASAMATAVRQQIKAPIAGVVTMLDSRLRIACELARILEVPGPDTALLNLKSKQYVQSLIPLYSPKTLSITASAINKADFNGFLSNCTGDRFIIKPSDTAGAIGFRQISRNQVNAQSVAVIIAEANIPKHLNPGHWLIQEKCMGELVSVEGFVRSGELRFVGASGRKKILNTESAMYFPYEHRIHPLAWITTKEAVRELVQKSGFRDGYFHIEFIVEGTDVRLIDANMGRPGGGPLMEVISSAFDLSPVQPFKHAIAIALGVEAEDPYLGRAANESIGICYGIQEPAVLHSVRAPSKPRVRHTQILASGTSVPEMGRDNWSWLGLLSGPIAETEEHVKNLLIDTDRGAMCACY